MSFKSTYYFVKHMLHSDTGLIGAMPGKMLKYLCTTEQILEVKRRQIDKEYLVHLTKGAQVIQLRFEGQRETSLAFVFQKYKTFK